MVVRHRFAAGAVLMKLWEGEGYYPYEGPMYSATFTTKSAAEEWCRVMREEEGDDYGLSFYCYPVIVFNTVAEEREYNKLLAEERENMRFLKYGKVRPQLIQNSQLAQQLMEQLGLEDNYELEN